MKDSSSKKPTKQRNYKKGRLLEHYNINPDAYPTINPDNYPNSNKKKK